jgi:hypothetical protein
MAAPTSKPRANSERPRRLPSTSCSATGYLCAPDCSIIGQNIVKFTGFSAPRRYVIVRHRGNVGMSHAYGLDAAWSHPLIKQNDQAQATRPE